jgi:small subunit ribosomal protein S3
MGQKVHPIGMRLGFIKNWNSVWYAGTKDYAKKLQKDIQVRDFLRRKLAHASISCIKIERPAQNAKVTIFTSRPGIVIGKKGEDVEILRRKLAIIMNIPVQINIEEIKYPELSADLLSKNIAQQLEKRIMFRRAMKRAIQSSMKMGAKGIKVAISGRLGGAEIARTEWLKEGCIPLHTFRADVDYGCSVAFTTYGTLGVKVWIFKGEVLTQHSSNSVLSKGSIVRNRKVSNNVTAQTD